MSKNFEFVLNMIIEATILKEESYHVLCIEDDYERYIMKANWYNGEPTVYITHDSVRGDAYIHYEVKEVNRTEIDRLLEVWDELVDSFNLEEV